MDHRPYLGEAACTVGRLCETHTQLYRRGNANAPNQFSRLVLLFEDGAEFISEKVITSSESAGTR